MVNNCKKKIEIKHKILTKNNSQIFDGTFRDFFPGKFRKMMIEIGLMPSTIM